MHRILIKIYNVKVNDSNKLKVLYTIIKYFISPTFFVNQNRLLKVDKYNKELCEDVITQ